MTKSRTKHERESGVTLVECLVSIALLSALLASLLGAFIVSRTSTEHARHRLMAMNYVKDYLESEFRAGYSGGDIAGGGSGYVMATDSAGSSVTLDDRNTTGSGDDLLGTIAPEPYPATTALIDGKECKTLGYVVTWTEDRGSQARERAAVRIAKHS